MSQFRAKLAGLVFSEIELAIHDPERTDATVAALLSTTGQAIAAAAKGKEHFILGRLEEAKPVMQSAAMEAAPGVRHRESVYRRERAKAVGRARKPA